MTEQDVIKILNQLSDTGNKAFEILVQQAILDAWIFLVILILSLTFAASIVIKYNKVLYDYPSNDEKEVAQFVIGVTVVMSIIVFCILIYPLVVGFINPEYLAIKELLGAL